MSQLMFYTSSSFKASPYSMLVTDESRFVPERSVPPNATDLFK